MIQILLPKFLTGNAGLVNPNKRTKRKAVNANTPRVMIKVKAKMICLVMMSLPFEGNAL